MALASATENAWGYWGRIPKALEQRGAAVFFGGQDGGGSVEGNAAQLKERMEAILTETGCSKVNIIAHSKGGLEARSLISTLGMGSTWPLSPPSPRPTTVRKRWIGFSACRLSWCVPALPSAT